jgi:hypothetical protein
MRADDEDALARGGFAKSEREAQGGLADAPLPAKHQYLRGCGQESILT